MQAGVSQTADTMLAELRVQLQLNTPGVRKPITVSEILGSRYKALKGLKWSK